ncbi:uncharacterized protein TRAVEDRAFT_50663 [Trametes versicolor FP-101664 SS1]|uniref:uncharacterized protein n=1 Tax=Trametes versicolor (strain FP-101664) TaxID=717944 RepID=UPI000462281A|nr:uncharacterized protein TRAVEDRAFT_50663 [Trametes versicolor FP-101664 SS1]EIW56181.1 hypothetical protein TRAVEDRAFT_50663 [Trametes versicolor FP-101664 SS1]
MAPLPSEEHTYQGRQGAPTCTRATIAPAHGHALSRLGLLASARPHTYSRRAPPCPLPSHGRRARMEDVVLLRLDASRPGGRAHPRPVLEQAYAEELTDSGHAAALDDVRRLARRRKLFAGLALFSES